MNTTIIGYQTFIETMDHAKRFEECAHPQCELPLALNRWRFLQQCADAEGCWVVLERVEARCGETDFTIVRTDIQRITCLEPGYDDPHVRDYLDKNAFSNDLVCILGGKAPKPTKRTRPARKPLRKGKT